MNYGKGLKLARAIADLNQKDLALKAGLDPSHISLIEKVAEKPSLEALEKLSQALGIPSDLFLLMAFDKEDLKLRNPEELQRAVESIARLVLQYAPSKSSGTRKRRTSRKPSPRYSLPVGACARLSAGRNTKGRAASWNLLPAIS